MTNWQERTIMLLGKEAIRTLSSSHVLLFGLGGVGGHTFDSLVRGGIGTLTVVDADDFCPSNLNRQLLATRATIGEPKVDVAVRRAQEINPDAVVIPHRVFVDDAFLDTLPWDTYDYVIDAIDTMSAKVSIAKHAKAYGVPIVSCMSTGNKLDATQFQFADLYTTRECPVARVMRSLCRKAGIDGLTVLYSREPAVKTGTRTPASCSYVPSVAGLLLAGYVINHLCLPGEDL